MRVAGSWSLLLAASFTSGLALAQPVAPPPPPPPPPPASEEPAATPEPSASPSETTDTSPETGAAPPNTAPLEERRPATVLAVGASPTPPGVDSDRDFRRNYDALPLTLEARFGFNARLDSNFGDGAQENHWGPSYAFAAYLALNREFSLGLELDHVGLGRVRALTGQNSIDSEYGATGAWLGARVFPIRRERLDMFVNLRVGLVFQQVDARGTRADATNITVPARSFACNEWDGPGFGFGGAFGVAYRLGRRVSFVSRVDLTGARLSGDTLGECAAGIGSVASLGGSVGLTYEFETAPK